MTLTHSHPESPAPVTAPVRVRHIARDADAICRAGTIDGYIRGALAS